MISKKYILIIASAVFILTGIGCTRPSKNSNVLDVEKPQNSQPQNNFEIEPADKPAPTQTVTTNTLPKNTITIKPTVPKAASTTTPPPIPVAVVPTSTANEPATTSPKSNSATLVLSGVGINIGTYDPATNKAGDILFTKNIGSHFYKKALLEFAAKIGASTLPHPTFFLPRGTKIFSPVSGKVENLQFQARDSDYEMIIVPDGAPNWRVSIDHVLNVTKAMGDTVMAGEMLAEVAQGNSAAVPPELGWFELQVWKATSEEMLAYCPFALIKEGLKQDMAAKIKQLAVDWNNFLGENVYETDKWTYPGCLANTAAP